MSAPARGRGGGSVARGNSFASRGSSTQRGSAANARRGRGRGRGRGAGTASTTEGKDAGGLLQQLRTGTIQRTKENGATASTRGQSIAGRARSGAASRAQGNTSRAPNTTNHAKPAAVLAPPTSYRDFMSQMTDRFNSLKSKRDAERKRAIQDGVLADPDKKTNLANAITPVGTCIDMCPEFERVERVVQNMVDRAEKVPNEATGRDMPSEHHMVKRFRRSAAGYDEQLPSDIRTPETLRRTLDYLFNKVIGGGERLAVVHKFVWDRTRGIRNDFSIQQVSKIEDVAIAVDCYERIARFHILSLHQLSNPDNLQEGEHFDAHQEREQLNNTLLSLIYYYDDNRGKVPLPNEPEFRSYCILFELQTLHPDLEDRMQSWPVELLTHPKVHTAFKLYAAASNTIMDQGPLRPLAPFSVGQSNSGKFWTILSSQEVSYIMACVAEINFGMVRFIALDALWRSSKSAPQGQQARNQDWTVAELQNYLAFDDEDQTLEFCQAFDLAFKNSDRGEQCLDFTATTTSTLDKTSIPSQQIFSLDIVEDKRYRRTLVAVINGVNIASAIKQGLVVESIDHDDEAEPQTANDNDQSLFVPEAAVDVLKAKPSNVALNPAAAPFKPPASLFGSTTSSTSQTGSRPLFGTTFGANTGAPLQKSGFGNDAASGVSKITGFPPQVVSDGSISKINDRQPFTDTTFGSGMFQGGNQSTFKPQVSVETHTASGVGVLGMEPSITTPSPGVGFNRPEFNSGLGQDRPSHQQSQTVAPPANVNLVPDAKASFSDKANVQEKQPEPVKPTHSPLFGTLSNPQEVVFDNKDAIHTRNATPPPSGTQQQNRTGFANESATSNVLQPFQAQPASVQGKEAPRPAPVFSFEPQSKSAEPGKTITFTKASTNNQLQQSTDTAGSQVQSGLLESRQTTKFFSQQLSEVSTTPQGSPKRPGVSNLQPPSVTQIKQSPFNHVAASDPTTNRTDHTKPTSQSHVDVKATEALTPQLLPSQKPVFTEQDRAKLVETTSRILLTQKQGLIEYFVSHHVSNLLQSLVKGFLREQHNQVITRVRTRHLTRKFFAIWRERTRRSVLNRRAKHRRKLLATAMQAEMDKKRRDEAELEAILAATRETKQIQEEQQKINARPAAQRTSSAPPQENLQAPFQKPQMAGRKRKTISQSENSRSVAGTPPRTWSNHKRSRTVDTMSEPSTTTGLSTSLNTFRISNPITGGLGFGRSLTNRLSVSTHSQRSLPQRVDSTKTDYFKLKAMGIDPNTPLIPDTAKGLHEKRTRMQQERQELLDRSRTRPSMFSASMNSRPSTPSMEPPPPKSHKVAVQSSPLRSVSVTPNPTPSVSASLNEDDFLKQLREARESLASDADWFKNQTAVLEKEIVQQEDLRKSLNSQNSSQYGSPKLSVSGYANVNGVEYYPLETKPGSRLSRTEARIRRTGAHGLATRAVGSDYVPVAMSRKTASRHGYGLQENLSTSGTKRRRDDVDFLTAAEATDQYAQMDDQGSSAIRSVKPTPKRAVTSYNAFAALHDEASEDENEDLEEEVESSQYDRDEVDGDGEDNDEDLYEDEEDEEDGSEEQNNTDAAHPHAVLGNLPMEEQDHEDEDEYDEEDEDEDETDTPGTYPQYSRAQSKSSTGMQSGPGASMDDALVLSD